MSLHSPRSALALVLAASFLSCSENPIRPAADRLNPRAAVASVTVPPIVISQVYGGGGNTGATLKNDFIELFNPGSTPVSVTGWSVQYASSAGSSWSTTPLSGTIQPGSYYLVQEAAGSGGTESLPTPDATGTLTLSATAGKVWLSSSTAKLTGTCPTGGTVVDGVPYGSANCANPTDGLSNGTAALRNGAGCAYAGVPAADFTVGTPAPRNSQTPVHACVLGNLDHVVIVGAANLIVGGSAQLAAVAQDANGMSSPTAAITWSSSNAAVAAVDATGKVSAISASIDPVAITATATENGQTVSGSVEVIVNAPGPIGWLDLTTASSSFPPGFQTQMFATARASKGGAVVGANLTFESLDPMAAVATVPSTGVVPVQNSGLVSALAVPGDTAARPRIRVLATPAAGGPVYAFVTRSIMVERRVEADPSIYGRNDEFGDPTAATLDNPIDKLIVRPQYTLSYNEERGTPNWVSYELDARQMGGEDRCNCFTVDPVLVGTGKEVFTSDYTNGKVNGGSMSRGHMARSADRTAANVDNGTTYYLTNIVPQSYEMNSGVWANLENALADSARNGGRALYIITGPLYSHTPLTFLKDEGKVAVPDAIWKVAFIGPRNGSAPFDRGSIRSWSDLDGVSVLAVIIPNVASVAGDPWSNYLTTIDQVEAATGYDFLSLLQPAFQTALEAGDHAPEPSFAVSGTLAEGAPVSFDAGASTDRDLGRSDLGRTEALTYTWDFGDGHTGSGETVSHSYADNGSYTATLTVADAFGWTESLAKTVTVANVAPTVTFGATSLAILSGDSVFGSFSDPGADAPWHAVADWGNGTTAASTWSAPGAIGAASSFLAPGAYTLTLTVTDKDGASGSASVSVTVAGRAVPGEANPRSINPNAGGDIKITLDSAPGADVTTLDVGSVAVGSVGLAKKVMVTGAAGGTQIVLRFDRRELAAAGLLTSSTTELVVTGTLASGVHIVSHVPVNVH